MKDKIAEIHDLTTLYNLLSKGENSYASTTGSPIIMRDGSYGLVSTRYYAKDFGLLERDCNIWSAEMLSKLEDAILKIISAEKDAIEKKIAALLKD
jgi:hypothetical protein